MARRSRPSTITLLAAATVLVAVACSSNDTPGTVSGGGSSSAITPPANTTGTAGTSGSGGSTVSPSSGFTLTSSAFSEGGDIPVKYACAAQGGQGASPPLSWSGTPANAKTLVLVVHDPDAPRAGGFTHLVTSFPATTTSFADAANEGEGPMKKWVGPCPPSGTHHYEFTLYAFGADTTIAADADKSAIDAVAGKALAKAKLTGLFAHR